MYELIEKKVDGVVRAKEGDIKIIFDAPLFTKTLDLIGKDLRFFSKPNVFYQYTIILYNKKIIALKCNSINKWFNVEDNSHISDIQMFKSEFLKKKTDEAVDEITKKINEQITDISVMIKNDPKGISEEKKKSTIELLNKLNQKLIKLIERI